MAYDGGAAYQRGRPLRVALFSGNYNYTADGANKALNRLVGHLERNEGFKVRVYSPTSPTPAFAPQGELVSVPSFPLPLRSDYRMALGVTPAIGRDVAAFAPDIIHLSAPDVLGFGAQGLARRLGVPVVASVHTLFETYLQYYGLGWLRPALEARLAGFYRQCDYILAPTPVLAAQVGASAGLSADHARVWSRGVDRVLFDPGRRRLDWRRAHGFADDDCVMVYFGRIVMEKGLSVFAEAARQMRGPKVKMLVIGDGPARPWFEEALPDAVFTGHLSGEALATAIACGDLLINPSCTESFCNVTLEAMASGLAVVCSDAPNHLALVPPSVGVLCPATDAGAFAAAALRLADDPALRRACALAARAQSSTYDWETILSGVADLYREACAASAFNAAA